MVIQLLVLVAIATTAPAAAAVAAAPATQPATAPAAFSKTLQEGNYLVTIKFGRDDAESEITVKAETRRLMLERVRAGAGESVTRQFAVNVRTHELPHGSSVRIGDREKDAPRWDEVLMLEVLGYKAAVRSVDVAPAPPDTVTVYPAGDSTVTDQRNEPFSSWGQMLPRFFKPSVAVANHAESGRALRSFRNERRLEKILGTIKPGDYL